MTRLSNLLLVILLLSNSACATAPVKDFTTITYLPTVNSCFERLRDDNTVERVCYPEADSFIAMPLSSFQKELNYQDFLILKCSKWKK